MLELVDNRDLKSRVPSGREGSTPSPGIFYYLITLADNTS